MPDHSCRFHPYLLHARCSCVASSLPVPWSRVSVATLDKADVLTGDGELTYVSIPFEKVEQDSNGDVLIWGKATDGSVDSDQQIVDPEFAAKGIAEWLDTGPNVRVQHQAQRDPAGVGLKAERDDDAHWVKSKIIEPVAKRLVLGGALRAYSVGIARPTIQRDAVARGGRITDGQIVEISLVDRPANKNCGFQLVKAAADGTPEWVGKMFGTELLEKSEADVTLVLPSDVHIGFSPADMARILKRKADKDVTTVYHGGVPKADDEEEMEKADDEESAEKRKLTSSARNALPDSDFVFPGERKYPIHDESHARNALSRVPQHGTPEEKKRVRAAVHRRYPGIGQEEKKAKKAARKAAARVAEAALPDVTKPVEKKDKAACMGCGAMQNSKHVYCSECGSSMGGAMPVEKNHDFMCLGCGREMDKGEKFCPGCGKPNPGHNPMADMKIPANKAERSRVATATVTKAKKPRKGKKGGKPFGGNQAPPFGSKDTDDGKDDKGMDAPVTTDKDAVRYDGGVPAGSMKGKKGGFGSTPSPGEGVTGERTQSVPAHREPDGLDVAAFEHDAKLPTDSRGDRQSIPAVKGGKLNAPESHAIAVDTSTPGGKGKKRKRAKDLPVGTTPAAVGGSGEHAHPVPGHRSAAEDQVFDRDASKGADPEIARVLRLKSLGIPDDIGYAHDLVCPAYGWDDLVKCYPQGLEGFSADDWQQKALSAAASAPLAEAMAASQLGQHAFTIKSADLADLIDVKTDLNKAFRDANPGPGSFPTPGEIRPSAYRRPKITADRAAYSHQYGPPNTASVPDAGGIHAGSFSRGFIQSGRADDSPANKSGAPYPPETGKPVNLDYSSIHKGNVAQAFIAMHDHFDRVFPGVCPMNGAAAHPGRAVDDGVRKDDEPEVTKKVSPDGMSKKARKRRDKKLTRAVMKGKMPLDEARIKMGKKPRKSPDPLQPNKAAAEPDMTKTVRRESAGTDITKAVAAALRKSDARNGKRIRALTRVVNALADQPDPRTQPFKGLARNPIQKSARPAGVQSIAESAERAQLMVVRELENTARNSPDPTTREAAWQQVLKFKGLVP